MNTRLLFVGSGLIAGISLTCAWRSAKATEDNENGRIQLVAQRATAQASLQRDFDQLKAAESREEELKIALEKARAELGAASSSASIRPPAPAKDPKTSDPARMTMQQVIANDPKLQALALAARRASLERTYGPLFRSLGLQPADGEKFCEIMIRGDELAQDLMVTIQTKGLSPSDPGVASFRRKAEEELHTAQRELLGAAGFAQLQEYQRQRDARQTVGKFAGAAALADVPLTHDQAERMTQAITNASTSYREGRRLDWLRIDWTVADAGVTEVLSPAQFALFKRIEPLGGGTSRWMGILNQRMDAARKSVADGTPR